MVRRGQGLGFRLISTTMLARCGLGLLETCHRELIMTTQEPPLGSHLKSSRRGYTHHGIYVGQRRVIHYAGWANNQATGPVEETDLNSFTQGNGYSIVHHYRADLPEVIVARARRRIGETDYNLASNNCEHFCNSCVNDDHHSRQVDVATAPGALTLGSAAGLAARAIVAASGAVSGLSGPGITSGLATVGGVVGGGAIAGLAVLGGIPGLTATRSNCQLCGSLGRHRRQRCGR